MSLLGILVAILVICVVIWAVRALMAAFGVPDPIRTVIFVVVVLLALLWFLGQVGIGPGLNVRL